MDDKSNENSSDISELALTGGNAALLRTLDLMRKRPVRSALEELSALTRSATDALTLLDELQHGTRKAGTPFATSASRSKELTPARTGKATGTG